MTTDRIDADPSRGTDEGSPFVAVDEDFVDVLCRFLRTIPIYPDGHSRVVSVSERLHATASRLCEPVVVEVADHGLLVNGADRGALGPGPTALRAQLLATAVVRVVFHPEAPPSSYVAFARSLQRNARLATTGRLAFADLWMSPILGIEVHELVFASEGFVAAVDAPPTDDEATPSVLGSVEGDGEGAVLGGGVGAVVPGALGAGDGAGVEADPEASAPPPPPVVRRPLSVSRGLRDLVAEDPELEASIFTLEVRLLADRGVSATHDVEGGADVLEHLVRALPLEARLDPAKGLAVLRRVVERLLTKLPEVPPAEGAVDLPTRFFQVLERVFPKRECLAGEPPRPSAPELGDVVEDASGFDELFFLDDSILDGLSDGAATAPLAGPELEPDPGITDAAAVLLHAVLEEPAGARRDELRTLCVAAYVVRPRDAAAPCLATHLGEAIAAPADVRDLDRIALLESIAEEAGVRLAGAVPALTPEAASALFPCCLGTYLRGGGRAGAVARRVGRERVLAAAAALAAPRGVLAGDLVERLLAERTFDALPFLEALLVAVPASRPRVARALRALDFRSLAAVAFRVVPEARLSEAFLRVLCEDGFAGVDSRRLDAEAAAGLSAIVLDADGAHDVRTRTYATAALGTFPAPLAEPALRVVATRRLFGGAPKEVRLAAEEILRRLDREAAEARPVP